MKGAQVKRRAAMRCAQRAAAAAEAMHVCTMYVGRKRISGAATRAQANRSGRHDGAAPGRADSIMSCTCTLCVASQAVVGQSLCASRRVGTAVTDHMLGRGFILSTSRRDAETPDSGPSREPSRGTEGAHTKWVEGWVPGTGPLSS